MPTVGGWPLESKGEEYTEAVNVNIKQGESDAVAERNIDDWIWLAVPENARGSPVGPANNKVRDWVWLLMPRGFMDFLAVQKIGSEESEFDFLRGALERFSTQCAESVGTTSETLKLIGNL